MTAGLELGEKLRVIPVLPRDNAAGSTKQQSNGEGDRTCVQMHTSSWWYDVPDGRERAGDECTLDDCDPNGGDIGGVCQVVEKKVPSPLRDIRPARAA